MGETWGLKFRKQRARRLAALLVNQIALFSGSVLNMLQRETPSIKLCDYIQPTAVVLYPNVFPIKIKIFGMDNGT